MPFISAGDGELKRAFLTNQSMLDSVVGSYLYAWGRNQSGKLGNNTNVVSESYPVQVLGNNFTWKNVFVGQSFVAATKDDGTLWNWGQNSYGQLGDNTTTNRSSPIQTIAGGNNWSQVACGSSNAAAIKTDGTLWTWGANSQGELGINTTAHRSSPVQTITYGTNWRSISCGYSHLAATKTDGTLWLWGWGSYGQLGNNSATNRSSPVQTISVGNNWSSVACGTYNTAAIKTDGTLWTWGYNYFGQIGNNTVIDRSSPIQTITGGNNWKQVSCGYGHMAAIKTDGTLWLWGRNAYGELGDNSAIYKSSPVQTIARGTNWSKVACGYSFTAAIKTDGSMWTWGFNDNGTLADGSSTHKSSPVQVATSIASWKSVSCKQETGCAIAFGAITLNTSGAEMLGPIP